MVSSSGRGTGGRDTTPRDFPEINPRTGQAGHDFTLQAVMEMQRALGGMEAKIDGLLKAREIDRADYRDDIKALRADLQTVREKDVKALSDEIAKLKLQWAKIAGAAAVIAAIVTFLGELLRAKLVG